MWSQTCEYALRAVTVIAQEGGTVPVLARSKIALIGEGVIQRQGDVIHIMVHRLQDLSERLANVAPWSRDSC